MGPWALLHFFFSIAAFLGLPFSNSPLRQPQVVHEIVKNRINHSLVPAPEFLATHACGALVNPTEDVDFSSQTAGYDEPDTTIWSPYHYQAGQLCSATSAPKSTGLNLQGKIASSSKSAGSPYNAVQAGRSLVCSVVSWAKTLLSRFFKLIRPSSTATGPTAGVHETTGDTSKPTSIEDASQHDETAVLKDAALISGVGLEGLDTADAGAESTNVEGTIAMPVLETTLYMSDGSALQNTEISQIVLAPEDADTADVTGDAASTEMPSGISIPEGQAAATVADEQHTVDASIDAISGQCDNPDAVAGQCKNPEDAAGQCENPDAVTGQCSTPDAPVGPDGASITSHHQLSEAEAEPEGEQHEDEFIDYAAEAPAPTKAFAAVAALLSALSPSAVSQWPAMQLVLVAVVLVQAVCILLMHLRHQSTVRKLKQQAAQQTAQHAISLQALQLQLEDATARHHEEMQQRKLQQAAQMRQQAEQHDEQCQQMQQRHQAELESVRSQMAEQSDTAVQRVRSKFEEEMEDLKEHNAAVMHALESNHKQVVMGLKAKLSNARHVVKQLHGSMAGSVAKVAKLTSGIKLATQALQARVNEVQAAMTAQVSAAVERQQQSGRGLQQLQEVVDFQAQRLQQLQAKAADQEDSYRCSMARLQQQYSSAMHKQAAEHSTYVRQLCQQHERELCEVQQQCAALAASRRALQKQVVGNAKAWLALRGHLSTQLAGIQAVAHGQALRHQRTEQVLAERVESLRQQNRQLQARVEQLVADVASGEDAIADLHADLQESIDQNTALQAAKNISDNKIQQHKAMLDQLQQQLQEADASTQEDHRRIADLEHSLEEEQTLTANLQSRLSEVDAERSDLACQLDSMSEMADCLSQIEQRYVALKSREEAVLARMAAQQAEADQALGEARAEGEGLRRELADVKRQLEAALSSKALVERELEARKEEVGMLHRERTEALGALAQLQAAGTPGRQPLPLNLKDINLRTPTTTPLSSRKK